MTATAPSFAKLVPGFDFLQSLVTNANAVLPGIGQWVAPTLDPEEIDKRIDELRTVQFWLEQNARMLAATIQALEVQRMTLATLKTMNVRVADLGEALRGKPTEAAQPPSPAAPTTDEPAATPAVVDPMQWWGALTRQFTELASQAIKDAGPAQQLAGQLVQQGLQAGGGRPTDAVTARTPPPARAATGTRSRGTGKATSSAAKPARKTVAKRAGSR